KIDGATGATADVWFVAPRGAAAATLAESIGGYGAPASPPAAYTPFEQPLAATLREAMTAPPSQHAAAYEGIAAAARRAVQTDGWLAAV
ncbi:MAG TPA: hypothetical protein VIT92_08415, partial [Burkholderiaceae bacterium]